MTAPSHYVPSPPVARRPLPFKGFLIAGAASFVLSFLLLVGGLVVPSLALVYLSIAASLLWLPLLVTGGVLAVVDSRRG